MTRRSAGGLITLPLLLLAATGCPGDGSELVDDILNGGGIEPNLTSIQANVFGPVCTECHFPGGPGPMPLDSVDASFQNLVNVASIEVAGLDRIEPGDPEASYLVWKIEGRPEIVADRMPPPPRATVNAEAIAAIRDWITMGAPPADGGSGGLQPTLASIQENIFTPKCTECHVPGGIGPMPLDSEQASFDSLVDVSSIELGSLDRVEPGDPEDSYLIWKVEGRPEIVAQRMPPPPRNMLTPEEIQAIADWIQMGALP